MESSKTLPDHTPSVALSENILEMEAKIKLLEKESEAYPKTLAQPQHLGSSSRLEPSAMLERP